MHTSYNASVLFQRLHDTLFPGTHWVYEMANMLLRGRAETIQQYKGKHQLEFATNDALSSLPSPRIINTHFRLSDAPREVKEKKCKIIYNLRDPKDVAVSIYHAYIDLKVSECECSFEGFLYLFLEGKGAQFFYFSVHLSLAFFYHNCMKQHFTREKANEQFYSQFEIILIQGTVYPFYIKYRNCL